MTIVGIDLGTTFSAISIVRESQPHILPVNGENIMPSVVGVSPEGRWLVGKPALNQIVLHPESTVRSIKRKMGTDQVIALGGETYTPPQISAIILQALKQSAQDQLGEEISQAVITVPAYFSDAQRQATRDAGAIAGLDVVRILNEPTAAALAYGLQQNLDQVALVYDLGGGTFDVSLVEFSSGVVDVRASHGNTRLGGDDFDERLAQWLVGEFEEQHHVDLRTDEHAYARVRRAAEQAKIALSKEPYTWVREEYLTQQRGVPLHMEIEVSRPQFLDLIDDLLLSTVNSIERVLTDSKTSRPDHVLLVGGSTYIPAVWELVAEHTGVMPRQDINPSEAVALGAGIQGAIIDGEPIDAILVDVTPFSLGIEIAEITSFGSLIEDRFKPLIHRNTTIPTAHSEVFSALTPMQREAKISVFQGESTIASQNALLGEFLFSNLTPEEDGEPPHVTVDFDIDVNGILNVKATDRGSGRAAGITVKASRQRLTQAEIQSAQITLPVAHHGANLPDGLIREADAMLARAQAVLSQQPDNEELEEAIEEVTFALEDDDEASVQEAVDNLADVLYELDEESGDDGE
jgi:molecular chaperone DnaK